MYIGTEPDSYQNFSKTYPFIKCHTNKKKPIGYHTYITYHVILHPQTITGFIQPKNKIKI